MRRASLASCSLHLSISSLHDVLSFSSCSISGASSITSPSASLILPSTLLCKSCNLPWMVATAPLSEAYSLSTLGSKERNSPVSISSSAASLAAMKLMRLQTASVCGGKLGEGSGETRTTLNLSLTSTYSFPSFITHVRPSLIFLQVAISLTRTPSSSSTPSSNSVQPSCIASRAVSSSCPPSSSPCPAFATTTR